MNAARAPALTREQVFEVANELRSKGQAASTVKVREALGGVGSYTSISKFLEEWRAADSVKEREVVADMPHVLGLGQYGGHRIHVSEVDCVIESDRSAFVLPEPIAVDGVVADLEDGVLTVTLPKSGSHRARKIDVT